MSGARRRSASARGQRAGPAFVAAAALTLGAATAAAAPPRAGEVFAWASRAVGELVRGELATAVASLTRARAARARPELDALVGLVALAGGDLPAAERQLERAVGAGSTEPLVHYWAGRAALRAGRHARALKHMEAAVSLGGERPVLRMGLAATLRAAGNTAGAAASLREVAAAQPNLLDPALYPTPATGAVAFVAVLGQGLPHAVQLRRTQGYLLWKLHSPWSAMQHFAAVLRARADDGDALQMLARCRGALGLTDQALQLAERAIRAAPDLAAAYGARGALLAERDPRRAAEDLQRAAAAAPRDPQLLLQTAEACAAAQQQDCARRFFAHAIRRDPRLGAAYFGLALLQQQARKLDDAERSFLRAVALEPGNPRFKQAAASFYATTGRRAQARRLLAAARSVAPAFARHERARGRAAGEAQRLLAALEGCGCEDGAPCTAARSARCRAAVQRLPEPARAFFRAHLALAQGRGPGNALAALAARLPLRRLLLSDPTAMNIKGISPWSGPFALRAQAPTVPAARWR